MPSSVSIVSSPVKCPGGAISWKWLCEHRCLQDGYRFVVAAEAFFIPAIRLGVAYQKGRLTLQLVDDVFGVCGWKFLHP